MKELTDFVTTTDPVKQAAVCLLVALLAFIYGAWTIGSRLLSRYKTLEKSRHGIQDEPAIPSGNIWLAIAALLLCGFLVTAGEALFRAQLAVAH